MEAARYFEADRISAKCALGYTRLPDTAGYRAEIFSKPARHCAHRQLRAGVQDLASFPEIEQSSRLNREENTLEVMRSHLGITGQPRPGYAAASGLVLRSTTPHGWR